MNHLCYSAKITLTLLFAAVCACTLPAQTFKDFDFEAHRVDHKVELKWEYTESVVGFRIERSLDNKMWENVITLSTNETGVGYKSYFEIDYDVPSIKMFYRVRAITSNGQDSYSFTSYVPSYDELGHYGEKIIKTVTDPIKVGTMLVLDFANLEADNLLLVIRDQCGEEFFAKVELDFQYNLWKVVFTSGEIPSGNYLITASSSRNLFSSQLGIEMR